MTQLASRTSSALSKFKAPSFQRDLLAEVLADKRSPQTRRAYERDLKDFFQTVTGSEPTPQLIAEFLNLERFDAVGIVLGYKAGLMDRGLAEATVNRRLAAIRSLVDYARKVGKCSWTLQDVKGEKVKSYRDTSGVSADLYKDVLASIDRTTLKGKRDYALLRLLWDNALRRGEVVKTQLKDFDPACRTLLIYGKGKGTQSETVSLSLPTVEALQEWLSCRELQADAPLFCSLDNASAGNPLTGDGIYKLVSGYCKAAGITKRMSPHRVRHSAVTAALDATGGDVRRVQKLSRHANLNTLMIYDDNRKGAQGEVTALLSEMV